MPPHLLRCQGLGVGNYTFALGRLDAEAPSTFAQLGYNISINRTLVAPVMPVLC